MRPLYRIFTIGAIGAMAVAATVALAHDGSCARGPWPNREQARSAIESAWQLDAAPGQGAAQHLVERLQLKADQQAAWNAYTATLSATVAAQAAPLDSQANRSAPRQLEDALANTRLHEQRAEARLEAMKALYAQLSPEQRKVFDEAGETRFRHHHGW